MTLEPNVSLAGLTTFEIGGPARWLARCAGVAELREALAWAAAETLDVFVLGGGSNLLVADRGFDGLVVVPAGDRIELERTHDAVVVRAEAGVEWDRLVELTVAEGLGGLERMSGIPGRVGAAPIQNIGAYGQEVAETIASIEVIERATGCLVTIVGAECGFSYRHSHFKGAWRERFVILAVSFRLERLAAPGPSLEAARREVLAVRREKSMVLDTADENRRSAGSFFLNPIVAPELAEQVRRRGGPERAMPVFPAPGGVKLSAAWLIEQAGFCRGQTLGRAAISTRHSLALVNRGGASAEEIIALAGRIRREVRAVFGVVLEPEPRFLGFEKSTEELLDRAE